MSFQPIINMCWTLVSMSMRHLQGYKNGHSLSSVGSKLIYYTILKGYLTNP